MPDENPLRPIVATWLKKIELAKKHKKPFADDAAEALGFYDSDPDTMWKDSSARGDRGYNKGIDAPPIRLCINRVWEAVRLFASVIHHRNPSRTITPKQYPIIGPALLGIFPQPPVPQMGPEGPVMGPDGQIGRAHV